ncbi:hypothetical protein BRD00_02890 [Halobacteriales archaeon QS_8_69_26]|nr:MAG: hypothetical protein BRD00_02890 [Halobacteriales archaeon QS_8_69_26]
MAESEARSKADELARMAETRLPELRGHVSELADLLTAESDYVRGRALRTVVRLTESYPGDGVALVDPLTECLNDDHLQDDAALALGNVADEDPGEVAAVLPALVAVIDEEGTIRVNVTYALESIAEADPEALAQEGVLERLFSLLDDETAEVRVNVTKTLGDIAGADPEAVAEGGEGLRERLEDDSEAVLKNAAYALGNVGVASPEDVLDAAERLIELTDHDDPEVRAAAAYALGYPTRQPSGRHADTAQSLLERLDHDDTGVKRHVTFALAYLAEENPEAPRPTVDLLTRRVADEDRAVRHNSLGALSALAEEFPEDVEAARDGLVGILENLDERDPPAGLRLGDLRGLAAEEEAPDGLRAAAERAVTLVESGAVDLEDVDENDEPGEVSCSNCGEPVDPEGAFCPACGTEIG